MHMIRFVAVICGVSILSEHSKQSVNRTNLLAYTCVLIVMCTTGVCACVNVCGYIICCVISWFCGGVLFYWIISPRQNTEVV